MRTRIFALVGASVLLSVGIPAAQARYGGALLGSNAHTGHGSVYTPPPGSPERQAIMDTLRSKVGKTSGKYVVFGVQHLRVSRGWAWAVVTPQSASGRTHYDRIGALLHKSGGQWTVTHLQEGASVMTDPDTLRDKYPRAPGGIF